MSAREPDPLSMLHVPVPLVTGLALNCVWSIHKNSSSPAKALVGLLLVITVSSHEMQAFLLIVHRRVLAPRASFSMTELGVEGFSTAAPVEPPITVHTPSL